MLDLFFYGALRHMPLLEIVLGRDLDGLVTQPAELPDHAVFWAQDEVLPLIVRVPGQSASGLLLRGLDAEDIARLGFYGECLGHRRETVQLRHENGAFAAAEMFTAEPGSRQTGDPWSLEDWAARWGTISCRAAAEMMAYYGRMNPEAIVTRLPSIGQRAAAWVAAQARPADPERDVARDVAVKTHAFSHMTFYGLEEAEMQFRRHDGTMSPVLNRSALMVGQAAVILPYDPLRDTVLLVEQFRAPVYLSGDRAPWTWEPVAGLVDLGEAPEATAIREAEEEAGLTIQRLEKVGAAYSSTGSSAEYLHLYVGITDLIRTVEDGGLETEGENIRSEILSFDALMEGVDGYRYKNLQLVTIALWLARHRDWLRGSAGGA